MEGDAVGAAEGGAVGGAVDAAGATGIVTTFVVVVFASVVVDTFLLPCSLETEFRFRLAQTIAEAGFRLSRLRRSLCGMAVQSTTPKTPQRADAKRNQQLLVSAAREVFALQGGALQMEAVAKAAGVGVGTLYRHFPTKQELLNALTQSEFGDILTSVEQTMTDHGPQAALERYFKLCAEFTLKDIGLRNALADTESLACPHSRECVVEREQELFDEWQRSGVLSADIALSDLMAVLSAQSAGIRAGGQTKLLVNMAIGALKA